MSNRKQRLSKEEREKQIIKCAIKVFARSNYRAAKIAEIAAEAGISEAMIYKYFPSKKVVFLKILEHMSTRLFIFLQKELDKDLNALETLRNMTRAYYQRLIKHPDELKVQFQAVSEIDDQEIFERLQADQKYNISFVKQFLKQGIEQGVIRKDINIAAVAILFNGYGAIMNMMRLLAFEDEFDEEIVDYITEHFITPIKV